MAGRIALKAEILTIGAEILLGRTVDTNSAFIGRCLADIGVPVSFITSVGDVKEDIIGVLEKALERVDIIIITGGLGPTHDDITRGTLAEFFGMGLRLDDDVLSGLKARYGGHRIPSDAMLNQATVLDDADILKNRVGTAPGYHISPGEGKHIFVLPGVPEEMVNMMEDSVIPILRGFEGRQGIMIRTLRTTGIPESALHEKLEDMDSIKYLSFLPGYEGVDVRVVGPEEEISRREFDSICEEIKRRVGEFMYGRDDEKIEELIGVMLRERGWKISVAESCTGGLIAKRITDIPGSSDYFDRGIIVYSNRSKVEMLGVPESLITAFGAVSAEVAVAMADGVRKVSGSEIGLSVTGIAGPSGGSPQKPVGLVHIGLSTPSGSWSREYRLRRNRDANRHRSSQAALDFVRRFLEGLWPEEKP